MAWLVGTVIRHNVIVVEAQEQAHMLDCATARLGRVADGVIVVAYVISVALYLRIMAQYMVALFTSSGSAAVEPIIACVAVALIVLIGALRGFVGLDRLDRVSLAVVLVLATHIPLNRDAGLTRYDESFADIAALQPIDRLSLLKLRGRLAAGGLSRLESRLKTYLGL